MKHSCWQLGINSINGSCRREIECPMGSMDNWVTFNGWIPLPVLLKCDTTRPAVLSCHISSIPWSLRSHKGRAEFLQKSWCLPTVPMLHGHFIYAWCTDVHNQMTESVTKGWRNDVLWLSPRLMPCIFGLDLVASYSKQAWLHWMLGGWSLWLAISHALSNSTCTGSENVTAVVGSRWTMGSREQLINGGNGSLD